MVTVQNIYDNIISQGFTYVKIYDLEGDVVAYLSGNSKKYTTPKEIKKYVEDYISENPGCYSFDFRKIYNSSNIIKYKKINCNTGLAVVTSDFDLEEERKKIRIELLEEEKEKQSKINYDAKVQELNIVWNKVGWLFEKAIQTYLPNMVPKGNLNGHLNAANTMSHDPIALTTMTEEQRKLSNEALLILLQCVNPETLHAVAVNLKNDPAKLSMLIKFVNS